jgi:hypothetical protein
MIMRKLNLLFGFVFASVVCFSQDTVYIEGLYITKYLKNETLFRLKNEVLRQQEKSFQTMIDYASQPYFCTLKRDSVIILMNEEDVEPMICFNQSYRNVDIYKFHQLNEYFVVSFKDKSIIHNMDFSQNCSYYISENDTTHVYRIYRVHGYALRIKINHDYLDPKRNFKISEMNIYSYTINENAPSFYVYLFYQCDIIDCSSPPNNFVKWKPNIEIQ